MKRIVIWLLDEGDMVIEGDEASFGDYAYVACKLMVIAADSKKAPEK